MVDLDKREPQRFKAYMTTVTLYGDRVEIRRRGLARFASAKDTVIPLADVVQVQWRDPTVMTNGCVFLATAEDVKTVKALGTTQESAMGGNPHVIVFTWRQRSTYQELRTALRRALPEVPTAPIG